MSSASGLNYEEYSFWDLLRQTHILIPSIQRDYVQARDKAKESRQKLVSDMVDAVKNQGQPLSLSFVYGFIENRDGKEVFIPIDGQQRLTTLFLLHLYVAASLPDDFSSYSEIFKRFSYNTRLTSQRFIEKLVDGLPKILEDKSGGNGVAISKRIQNAPWFPVSWEDDMTIKSCLVMLDAIENGFNKTGKDWVSYWDNLKNGRITFMYLELSTDFGSSNELYIRMNARGRQLTDFENFKVELFKVLGTQASSIEDNINGKWYDTMCNIVTNCARVNVSDDRFASYVDRLFLYVIRSVYTNCYIEKEAADTVICGKESGAPVSTAAPDEIYLPEGIGKYMANIKHYNMLARDKEFFKYYLDCLGQTMNLLSIIFPDITDLDSSEKYLSSGTYLSKYIGSLLITKDKKKEWKEPYYAIRGYNARLKLCAMTTYAITIVPPDKVTEWASYLADFEKWFRVINNLINNSETSGVPKFKERILGLCGFISNNNEKSPNDDVVVSVSDFKARKSEMVMDISKYLRRPDFDSFSITQKIEEIEKLKLIDDPDWKLAIYGAENAFNCLSSDSGVSSNYDVLGFNPIGVSHFFGRIYFLLHMAEYSSKPLGYNLDKFKSCCYQIFWIFSRDDITDWPKSDKNEREKLWDEMLHRVLLIFGDYSYFIDEMNYGKMYSLCRRNDSHRDSDWRGALRGGVNAAKTEIVLDNNKIYACFCKLVDDLENDSADHFCKEYADRKIQSYEDSHHDSYNNYDEQGKFI
ncbi:MAG: DUF262 domain-containing protein, partial [Clostridia bacterium]|nr:DUF262 domain-containing protein [Clostridia bacterium]